LQGHLVYCIYTANRKHGNKTSILPLVIVLYAIYVVHASENSN